MAKEFAQTDATLKTYDFNREQTPRAFEERRPSGKLLVWQIGTESETVALVVQGASI